MKEIIAVIARKGGDGKTTTAQAIGGELQKQGAKVLLIDLDAQKNLSASMGANLSGYSAAHLLDNTPAADTIQHTRNGDIIISSKFLASADAVIQSDNELKRAIRPIVNNYDYIIIDTPANYGMLTRNALTAATSAIITARAAAFSQQGLTELTEIINQIKLNNSALNLRGVIVTDYGARSQKAKAKLDDLKKAAKAAGTAVIEPPIRHTDKIGEAQDDAVNISDYAPRSTAARDYRQIVDKMLKWK